VIVPSATAEKNTRSTRRRRRTSTARTNRKMRFGICPTRARPRLASGSTTRSKTLVASPRVHGKSLRTTCTQTRIRTTMDTFRIALRMALRARRIWSAFRIR
jgi:hypothetical protein